MTLISQLKNYWNKLFSKKYKIGDEIKFAHRVNGILNIYSGTIEEVYYDAFFYPYCIKLHSPINVNGWDASYVNIKKEQILWKI